MKNNKSMSNGVIHKSIFIINGAGGTGKDEFIKCCSEYKRILNISSVDHVKDALAMLCPTYHWGLEKQKDEIGKTWRQNLHDLKTLSINMDDGPFKVIDDKILNFLCDDGEHDVLFIHVREPEEISKIQRCYSCKTLLITNINAYPLDSLDFEKNVVNFNYDITIDNDSTIDNLRENVKKFIKNYC
jgi:hypothetical protein